MNAKFHKKCENTGKILKISCVRSHFVKFDIYFLLFLLPCFVNKGEGKGCQAQHQNVIPSIDPSCNVFYCGGGLVTWRK